MARTTSVGKGVMQAPCRAALTLRVQGEAHTRPKHNILDSEITIGSFLWPNGLRRSKNPLFDAAQDKDTMWLYTSMRYFLTGSEADEISLMDSSPTILLRRLCRLIGRLLHNKTYIRFTKLVRLVIKPCEQTLQLNHHKLGNRSVSSAY